MTDIKTEGEKQSHFCTCEDPDIEQGDRIGYFFCTNCGKQIDPSEPDPEADLLPF